MARAVCSAVGVGLIVIGWLAMFTWEPSPNWARWALGLGATVALLSVPWRRLAG